MATPTLLFRPAGDTTGSFLRFEGRLPNESSPAERAAFAAVHQKHVYYLEAGLSVVTKTLSRQAPSEWANPAAWQAAASSHLRAPLFEVSGIDRHAFQQTVRGVQLASSFMGKMAPWVPKRELLNQFTSFLNKLGNQISSGIRSASSTATYHLVLSYQPIRDQAGAWQLASTADCYFLRFTASDSLIYSGCASIQTLSVEFPYTRVRVSLNGANVADARLQGDRAAWMESITADRDSLNNLENFFGAQAAPDA